MREVAKVVKVGAKIVEVQTFSEDAAACESCPLKNLCAAKKNVHVVNPRHYELKIGDMVEINVPSHVSVSKLSALLYGIPVVILIVLMMILRSYFKANVYLSLVVALICVGGYYWMLNRITNKKIEKISPVIVRKIPSLGDEK